MTQSKRLLSLDVMRGITIAGMILVNTPGSWKYVYAPLRHATWNGLTPTDLVFPFFIFIMGVSIYFSLNKYEYRPTAECIGKVLKRTLLIFLVGLFLSAFTSAMKYGADFWGHIRYLGVMQRLAITYGAGSLILLFVNRKYLLHTSALIMIFYWALLHFTNSLELNQENIIGVIDRALFGEAHIYQHSLGGGVSMAFDPVGLLSSLGSIAQVLLGIFAGKMIREAASDKQKMIVNIFIFGSIMLLTGFMISYGCPLNKKLWSCSYTLVTSGFASLLLALLIWIIDINKRVRWSRFFESFGINPLYLYVQAALLGSIFRKCGVSQFLYGDLFQPLLGDYGASLAYAITFVCVNWIPAYILYKKQIFIKL